MILDAETMLSNQQALTGTSLIGSTNVIDLGSVRQVGAGRPLFIVLTIDVAPGGTSPTLTVALQTDDNSAFSSPATAITYLNAVAGASYPVSTQFVFQIPVSGLERYARLAYTQGGTSPTVTLSAHVTEMIQQDVKLPAGFSVQ